MLSHRVLLFILLVFLIGSAIAERRKAKRLQMSSHFEKNLSKLRARLEILHSRKARGQGPPREASSLPKEQPVFPQLFDKDGCTSGWTGPDCKTAVCWNETSPFYPHDGSFDETGETIVEDTLDDCEGNLTFPVDPSMTHDIFITTLSINAGAYVRLFDPKMQEIEESGEGGWGNYFLIQQFPDILKNHEPGLYTIMFQSNKPYIGCVYTVQSPTTIYPDGGFVKTPQDDVIQIWNTFPEVGQFENPFFNMPVYLAFRMSPDGNPGILPQSAHISSSFDDENVYLSFNTRAGCATPWIATTTFTCNDTLGGYELRIQGTDDKGYQWKRYYPVNCIDPTPITWTTPAPYPSCSPSVPKIDLLIAFDGSSSSNDDGSAFFDSTDAFYELGYAVQYGASQTRIILGSYDQKPYFDGQHFLDIASSQDYGNKLVNLMYTGYTGKPGNNVLSVLNYANGLTGADAFRTNSRKMIVYISTTNWSQDPTELANEMRQKGFEFFPIAYGDSANFTQAQLISPKCAMNPKVPWDFVDTVFNLISKLCSPTPVC